MLDHRESDKARRYIDLLDSARCNGRWHEIPELVRKVGKHAPQRKCLTAGAQAEYQIVSLAAKRPTTSSNTNRLQDLVPSLSTAIEHEKTYPEDTFQARTCLGWVHWIDGQLALAVSSLPSHLPKATDPATEKQGTLRGWTHVSIIKSAYIRGRSQETIEGALEALKTYEAGLPYISTTTPSSGGCLEQKIWTERFLARFCILASRSLRSTAGEPPELKGLNFNSIIAPFRAWAKFFSGMPTHGFVQTNAIEPEENFRRRDIWQAYYNTLSLHMQSNSHDSEDRNMSVLRLEQYEELSRIETIYENLLLKEISFPEASQTNTEVDDWISQVMANWRVTCGPNLHNDDLGPGGQEAAGRKVLNILYRAATRSFHSTSLLRNLFTVHASLAEFDLAGKALDSYLEIVSKGKARVEKSGEAEASLDDDETMLRTISAGIIMLCTFGRRVEAEKAQALALKLERWLAKHSSDSSIDHGIDGNGPIDDHSDPPTNKPHTTGPSLAVAYRAVGISQAHWARLTFEASKRADFQAMAIKNLRMALQSDFEDEENVETLYALALVLAEIRDIDGALACGKVALSTEPQGGIIRGRLSIEEQKEPNDVYDRRMIKIWHLVALLLSARQDFERAQDSCEAAHEEFAGVRLSQGDGTKSSYAQMGLFEKQNVIEVKMTQLALLEVSEGPEVAVNASGELLGLYANLFSIANLTSDNKTRQEAQPPPTTSGGTIRSFRGSLFGRSKDASVIRRDGAGSGSVRSTRVSSEATVAPTISITDNDSLMPPPSSHHSHHLIHRSSKKLQKRNSKKSIGGTLKSRLVSPSRTATARESNKSMRTARSFSGESQADDLNDFTVGTDNGYHADDVGLAVSHDNPLRPSSTTIDHDKSTSAGQQLAPIAHNFDHKKQPSPSGHPDQPPRQDIRLPTRPPNTSSAQLEPRFTQLDQQRQSISLLLKVWLLIAGLYRRAKLYEDAQGALDEAFKHIRSIEIAAATQDSSAHAFEIQGWGGVKSVEELWADVYTEKGNLSLARSEAHDAIKQYESALSHFPDHPTASVSLANLLLDIYNQILPPQPSSSMFTPSPSQDLPLASDAILASINPVRPSTRSDPKTPEALDRLAARDRAYGLLSSLTKLGSAWDNSEAWFALARVHEESGQGERAKEVLWWVVELEEKRPVRNWSVLGWGGCL